MDTAKPTPLQYVAYSYGRRLPRLDAGTGSPRISPVKGRSAAT